MNAASDERVAASEKAHAETDASASEAEFRAAFAAGRGLLAALRRLLLALRALVAAEAQVLRAGIPLVLIGAIALVAFSVSLWLCAVALIGWTLTVATHSIGIALAILVAAHVLLVIGIWFAIRHTMRQASFPQTRVELRLLGRELLHDVNRFADAAPKAAPEPERASRQGDDA